MAKKWVYLFDEMNQALLYAGGDWGLFAACSAAKGRIWRKWFAYETGDAGGLFGIRANR